MKNKTSKPYAWVPTLYIAEAIPYVTATELSRLMFQDMGVDTAEALALSQIIGLPWIVKPIWSPFIDVIKTKRWWVLSMQLFIVLAIALAGFFIPSPFWLVGTLAMFTTIAFASATHDISADGYYILALSNRNQELYVGVRNTFYRIGMVLVSGLLVMLVGCLKDGSSYFPQMSVETSWMTVFVVIACLMFIIFIQNSRAMPKVEKKMDAKRDKHNILKDFLPTFKILFCKPHIISSLCFIVLFRIPEGMITSVVPFFLRDSMEMGGIGMNDQDFGLIKGTLGVIGLLAGGLVGGWLVSKYGLKKCLWPLVLCISLPDIVYVYMAYTQTTDLITIGSCFCVEQVGYGLGFAAYTLYLVNFSRGERATSVFSVCTALQYLGGVILPGLLAAWLISFVDYTWFFIISTILCLVTFAVTAFVKIPEKENDSLSS